MKSNFIICRLAVVHIRTNNECLSFSTKLHPGTEHDRNSDVGEIVKILLFRLPIDN